MERLFGVGTRFPLIADRDLADDARHFNNSLPFAGEGQAGGSATSLLV